MSTGKLGVNVFLVQESTLVALAGPATTNGMTVHPDRSVMKTSVASNASVTSLYDKANDKRTLCSHCSDDTCQDSSCISGQHKWSVRFKESIKKQWRNVFRPIMKSSYPEPGAGAGWFEQIRYDMLLPASGLVARVVTLALLAFAIWAALWSVLTKDMLPHGNIFGLYMVVLFALILGYLVERIKLAPLLGMLIVGCFMRNVPPVDFTKYVDKTWSSALRNIALTIILTRAGLGLDQAAIQKRFWACMSLAFVPTISITVFITVVAHYMLEFPWLFSGALGFLISAVSPAVIVPIMLVFQEQKLGTGKGLPSLIIAAATLCDVIAICGNMILLGIALSNGSLVFNIVAAPVQIIVGIGFGLVAGSILVYFPGGDDNAATIFRFVLLLCCGVLCIFGAKIANLSGGGALGALTTPMVAVRGWKRKGYTNSVANISTALRYCWVIFQPILFGLIGAAVDFGTLRPQRVGLIVGLLAASHAFQFGATLLATCRFGFTWRENLFLAFSFLPKATIQAAIGSTALDIATKNALDTVNWPNKTVSDYNVYLGQDTLNAAVLAIVFMAPIGGVLLMLTGPKLLDKEPLLPSTVSQAAKVDKEDEELHPSGSPLEGIVNGAFDFDRDVRRRSASVQLQNLENRRGSRSNL